MLFVAFNYVNRPFEQVRKAYILIVIFTYSPNELTFRNNYNVVHVV